MGKENRDKTTNNKQKIFLQVYEFFRNWCSKAKKYYKKKEQTIIKYSTIFAIGFFLIVILFLTIFNSWLRIEAVANTIIIFMLIDTILLTLLTNLFFNKIRKKRIEKKAENLMESYSSWVHNSEFGRTYRLLEYLNKGALTEMIKCKNNEYQEEYRKSTNDYSYNNFLIFEKQFKIYHEAILEISKRPLTELKNMLSFIELPQKKNWLFALCKTIVLFFIPTVTFSGIMKVLDILMGNRNGSDILTMSKNIFRLFNLNIDFSDAGGLFGLFIVVLYILLFIIVFIFIYKDTKFDEPHIRKYLKSSITRAIEIKENKEETEPF